jgi:phage-related minor tail protein
MTRYNSNPVANNFVSQAHNSVDALHGAVSQALSHPTEQTIQQAENSMETAERAVHQLDPSLGNQGVELAEELLAEEKERFAKLDKHGRPINR